MTVWATVRHNGEDTFACCVDERNGKEYPCSHYDPEHQCRNCQYVSGKVMEQEEEE